MVQPQRIPRTFTPLVKYSGKELKEITSDAGLETTSCHFTWKEITDDVSLAERIEFVNQLGLKCMICSGGLGAKTEDDKATLRPDDHVSESVKKGGMIAGYHNHNGEFDDKIDGHRQYDIMLGHLDPSG